LRTTDGGQISLDWYEPESPSSVDDGDDGRCPGASRCASKVHHGNAPIAIFMPGVTGCSQAEYLKTFVPLAYRAGYRAVAINYRGMGNTELLTPKLYCGADDEDLRTALTHIRRQNPEAKIVATGISLGGVILCRYLISTGHASLVDAAFLVSVVWNFMEALPNMERGLNYPLNRFLTRSLIGIVNQHRHHFQNQPQYDMAAIQKCRTMYEFDEAFTIRMYNYESVKDYYTECIHKGKIAHIKKPTLCINAADDMFAPGESKWTYLYIGLRTKEFFLPLGLPMEEMEQSSHVAMLVTSRGGHIGFMDGLLVPRLTYSYMERILEQYLIALNDLQDFRRELFCDCTSTSIDNNRHQSRTATIIRSVSFDV